MVMMIAGEVLRRGTPEIVKRVGKKVGSFALLCSVVGVPAGILMANQNNTPEQHEVTADGGKAVVETIDRSLLDIHVIGFQTRVDNASAKHEIVNRKLVSLIPLPDIVTEVSIDNQLIDSDLCFKGGKKELKQWTEDGKKHVEYEINPADISVCSRPNVDNIPIIQNDGNWITNMNNASDQLNKLGRDVDDHKNVGSLDEANELQSRLVKIAQNAAMQNVNQQCAPKVFDITKQDLLDNVRIALGREDEVFTVKYLGDFDTVSIEGKSEVDGYLERVGEANQPDVATTYAAGNVGTCELSPELEADLERQREQAGIE